MQRGSSDFSEKFEYFPLSVSQLKSIIELVELRFKVHAFGFELKSVKPDRLRSKDFHKFDIMEIFDAIENCSEIIRTYNIQFCRKDIGNKAIGDYVTLGIAVTARSKFGDNDEIEKNITLRGLNCCESDFLYFKKAVNEIVKLKKYYTPGTDEYDDRLTRFIQSDFIDNESKTLIKGAVTTRQYELAIKAISGLVESTLRDKLLSFGVGEASLTAGIDLSKLAFNKNNGYLSPPWSVASGSHEGAHLLFGGFFLWIRNGFHHQTKIFSSKDGILELLTLAVSLIHIIRLCTRRE